MRIVATRLGFTLVELLVSLAVGAVLVGIAMTAMAPARASYAVRSARATMGTLVSRARAEAVERGQPVFFEIAPEGDSAWVRSDSTVIEIIRFREAMSVDVVSPPVSFCMTARGIAEPACGTAIGTVDVTFERAGRSAGAAILLYGQYLIQDSVPAP